MEYPPDPEGWTSEKYYLASRTAASIPRNHDFFLGDNDDGLDNSLDIGAILIGGHKADLMAVDNPQEQLGGAGSICVIFVSQSTYLNNKS